MADLENTDSTATEIRTHGSVRVVGVGLMGDQTSPDITQVACVYDIGPFHQYMYWLPICHEYAGRMRIPISIEWTSSDSFVGFSLSWQQVFNGILVQSLDIIDQTHGINRVIPVSGKF